MKRYIDSVVMTRDDGQLQIYDRIKEGGVIHLTYPEIIDKEDAKKIGWIPNFKNSGRSSMNIQHLTRKYKRK